MNFQKKKKKIEEIKRVITSVMNYFNFTIRSVDITEKTTFK